METKKKGTRNTKRPSKPGCGYNGKNPAELKSPRRKLALADWSVTELEAAIEEYFEAQERKGEPPTVSGLGWWLGLGRKNLLNYTRDSGHDADARKPWRSSILAAYQRIEGYLEEQLCKPTGQVAGVQFVLKNNYGWQDRQEIELSAQRVESLSDEELRAEIQRLQLPAGDGGE